MMNFSMSTMIYRPIKQVFDFVSRPENDFQWQYGTLASNRLSEDAVVMGSFFRSVGHLMGRRLLSTFEVTEYEPNRKYGFKSLSGPLNSQTSYAFEMAHGSTKIDVSIHAEIADLSQPNTGVLEKKLKKQLKENLALLKKILEAMRALPLYETNSLKA